MLCTWCCAGIATRYMKTIKNKYYWVYVCLFFGVTLFLTLNKHSRSGYFNYQSEVMADKAGYFVYLPAALLYQFDPHQFPDSIAHKTGDGFVLDTANHVVRTKYTCGVALMQAPFFLAADALVQLRHEERTGFSGFYQKSVNIAAIFYLLIGFIFLEKFLRYYFKPAVIYKTLALLFAGTNLYYYAIADTGMSHIYSFSLFCIFLYISKKTNFLQTPQLTELLAFGLVSGLIVLVRPINLLFLSSFLLISVQEKREILARVKRIISPRVLFILVGCVLLVMLPQFLYWQYSHKALVVYSYGKEGFNWLHPKLLHTWFSPANGLFIYSPLYLVMAFSAGYMAVKKQYNGIYTFGMFMVLSYILSCWWDWSFGCSFGARSFVEYLPVLSIPLAQLLTSLGEAKPAVKWGGWLLVVILALFNLKLVYSFDVCFSGDRNWDWPAYLKLVTSALK